jgi:hypothetical protein
MSLIHPYPVTKEKEIGRMLGGIFRTEMTRPSTAHPEKYQLYNYLLTTVEHTNIIVIS